MSDISAEMSIQTKAKAFSPEIKGLTLVLIIVPLLGHPQALWIFVPMYRLWVLLSLIILFGLIIKSNPKLKQSDPVLKVVWSFGLLIMAFLSFTAILAIFTENPGLSLHYVASMLVKLAYFFLLVIIFRFYLQVDRFWQLYCTYLTIISLLGILLFLLVLIGINLPHYRIHIPDLTGVTKGGFNYFNYYIGFLRTIYNFGSFKLTRVQGFCDEANRFSMMLLPALIYLEQKKVQTVIIRKYVFIQRVALFLTFSRAGWAMYIIYKFIEFLMSDRKVKILKSAAKWILLIGIMALFALSFSSETHKFALRKMILERMIFTREAKILRESIGIVEPRLEMLRNSLMIIQEKPITGVGPYLNAMLYLKRRKPNGITTAEVSGVLGIFAKFGLIVGGIGSLSLLYLVLFAFRRHRYKNEKAWFYMSLYLLLYAFLDMGFPSSFYFFMIIASVVAGSSPYFNNKIFKGTDSMNRAFAYNYR
jgi:hypothetical protein